MQIIIPNTSAAGLGLGTIKRYISGMPATDLQGLWLFQDGSVDAPLAAPVDSSGKGRTLSLVPGYSTPVRKAFGVAVEHVDGVAWDTGYPMPASFTALVAARPLSSGTIPANSFTWFLSSTANTFGETAADSNAAGPTPILQINKSAPVPTWSVFDNNGDIFGELTLPGPGSRASNLATVSAWTVDGPSDTSRLNSLGMSEPSVATESSIGAYFDGVTSLGNFAIGAWPGFNIRQSFSPLEELYAFAIYAPALSQADELEAMTKLRQIVAARGISI